MSCVVWATQSWGHISLGTHQGHQASSDRSRASLSALLIDPPQEILDVHAATEYLGEIPEAEAYANVGASTSLPDMAVGAAANVRATTSLAIHVGLGQTTHTKLRSEVDLGRAIGGNSASVASELPPPRRPPSFRATAMADGGATPSGSFNITNFLLTDSEIISYIR